MADLFDDVLERARAAWPGLALTSAQFGAWLASRVAPGAALDTLPTSDLYLACACAHGEPAAIALFEGAYIREIDIAAARARAAPGIVDEARQVVRDLLFVPRGDRPPAIASFLGRGDLRGWLRVIATREVIRLCKADHREVALEDDAMLDALTPASDPELDGFKQQYRDQFRVAFHEAVGALSLHDRRLLRHQVLDGLGVDQIAALFKVHRTTASRWLSAARDQLFAGTRSRLAKQLAISADEVDSLIRMIQSRLDVTLEHVLK